MIPKSTIKKNSSDNTKKTAKPATIKPAKKKSKYAAYGNTERPSVQLD